jgi:PAS domain S-box-containing protein
MPAITSPATLSLDVLIIDDDDLLCARLEQLLESEGIGALSVTSIAEARAAIEMIYVRLMIVDKRLGDGDGIDLCLEYRNQNPDKCIPILLLSGALRESDSIAASAAGADACLSKSSADGEVLQVVKNLLRQGPVSSRSLTTRSEDERVAALHEYYHPNSAPDHGFEDIARLASIVTAAPMSYVTFIDERHVHIEASLGAPRVSVDRSQGICPHTITQSPDILVLEDASADPLFANHPAVAGELAVRFYAGASIVTASGHALGTVCVTDTRPRQLSSEQAEGLRMLARQAMGLLELRHARRRLESQPCHTRETELHLSAQVFRLAYENAPVGIALVGLGGEWLRVNQSLCRMLGYSSAELLATTFQAITHPADLDTDLAYCSQILAGEITSYEMEKRYLHKDGRAVWALLRVSMARDETGNPSFFISQMQDISARKERVLAAVGPDAACLECARSACEVLAEVA